MKLYEHRWNIAYSNDEVGLWNKQRNDMWDFTFRRAKNAIHIRAMDQLGVIAISGHMFLYGGRCIMANSAIIIARGATKEVKWSI